MSETIEITKSIEIKVDIDFVSCQECGGDLGFTVKSDNFGDLQISVEPHNCNKAASKET